MKLREDFLHYLWRMKLFNLIDLKTLKEKNIVSKKFIKLKVLGKGDITSKLNISANFVSKQAKSKIEKVGGTLNILKKISKKIK